MRAVNLLPRDLERDSSRGGRGPYLVAAGGLAAVTAAAVVLMMSASSAVSDQKAQLESVQAQLAGIPAPNKPAVESGVIAQERTDRVAALAAALSTRVPVDRLLRELAFVLPEDAWLTGMTATAPVAVAPAGSPPGRGAPSAASGTPGVTIQGATYSHESVARVLARLSALPTLTGVRLTASALVDPSEDSADGAAAKKAKKQKPVVTFTITANVRSAGSA
jgi:Tfp pilus assembly protein PilN